MRKLFFLAVLLLSAAGGRSAFAFAQGGTANGNNFPGSGISMTVNCAPPTTNSAVVIQACISQAVTLGAGGGQGTAVHIPYATAGYNLGTTTISMSSEVYLVGDGPDSAVFTFSGTGSTGAFDFPGGTVGSGLENLKVESTGNSGTPRCVTVEGSSGHVSYQNHIDHFTCGSEQTNNLLQCLVLTPTPSGSAGSVFINNNVFSDWYCGSGAQFVGAGVISNGDYENEFRNFVVKPIVATGTGFSGTFVNDKRISVSVINEAATSATGIALTGNTNGDIIDLVCDLGGSPNKCGSDANGGSEWHISDANLTPMGTLPATDAITICTLNGSLIPFCPNGAAPTISSGFGTTPSVVNQNGPQSFSVNVGTGGTATAGVVAMNETAINGWNCPGGLNQTAHAGNRADDTVQTASSTTTVTVQNQTKSTGAAVAWTASDILTLACFPR